MILGCIPEVELGRGMYTFGRGMMTGLSVHTTFSFFFI